jgi:hypothetical protein
VRKSEVRTTTTSCDVPLQINQAEGARNFVLREATERPERRPGSELSSTLKKEVPMLLILLIIVLVLAFGGGGGYYGYRRWGKGGGVGIVGLVLIILLVLYLFGGMRM